jgi:hypothetical protein
MQYSFVTPPASRAADRPIQIDDALIAEAQLALQAAVRGLPPAATVSLRTTETLFAAPMAALCAVTRPGTVPIEKLIIAIKLAWANLPDVRFRFGDAGPDALSGAVSACIAAYFQDRDGRPAD